MKYTADNLVIHPQTAHAAGLQIEVTPQVAGWEYIHFQSRRLRRGESWSFAPGAYEIALVVFSGELRAASNRGEWDSIGKRSSVFSGLPEALYLPLNSTLSVEACNGVRVWRCLGICLARAPCALDQPGGGYGGIARRR